MSSTRNTLERIEGNLEESMGVRQRDLRPRLSPVASNRDTNRRPLRNIGRVDVNMVIPDPTQPRIEFAADALERLAHSIREKGQLSPIRVRWSEEFSKWIIISGERRWRAAKQAGLPTIDCHFHEGEELSRSEVLEEQLIENLLREDLKPIEEAKAFSMLMELNGWTGKQLAEQIHVDASKVTRALSLLKLPQDIQEQVDAGEISSTAAYQLSRLPSDEQRRKLAEQISRGELTRDATVSAVKQRKGKPQTKPRGVRQTFVLDGSWKVTVTASKPGSYHDVEQALLQALEEVRHRIANNSQLF